MTQLKILLLGKNGQLGWELHRTAMCLGEIVAIDYPEVDFTEPESLRKIVGEVKPDIIFNAVAYTAVDKAESEPKIAKLVNSIGPAVLAEESRRHHAVFVHYSTDFVFDGKKNGPYSETDVTFPLNVYGSTKLDGDRFVKQVGGNYFIFRTSWVYSIRRESFVLKVINWSRKQEVLRIVTDQIGCPSWARMLAEASTQAIFRGGQDYISWVNEKAGLYHLAGKGSASRYEWARAILNNDPNRDRQVVQRLEKALSSEFISPAIRPAYSVLDCSLFEKTFNLFIPDWRDSIKLAMSTLN